MIPTFIRSYKAFTTADPYHIATFADGANDKTVENAADGQEPFIGVFNSLGGDAGDMVDVHKAGIGEVVLAGPVAAGDLITSDADGKGIKAVATAGQTIRIVGYAEEPGVAGDIIEVWVALGLLHEA